MNKEIQINTLLSKGYWVVPCNEKKETILKWKDSTDGSLVHERITDIGVFKKSNYRIAFLTGIKNGNVLAFDFDLKYDLTGNLYDRFVDKVEEIIPSVLNKIMINKTPSGGYHWVFRLEHAPKGNEKLASRFANPDEVLKGEKVKVLIETRGEGGYICYPPMDGYETICGFNCLDSGLFLDKEEEEILYSIARDFNETKLKDKPAFKIDASKDYKENNPFEDYNRRGDIVKELINSGWSIVKEDDKKIYLKRPGDSSAKQSGNFHKELRLFYVFSTSTEFNPNQAYKPSTVFKILKYNGDGKLAFKDLIKQGYGDREYNEFSAIENDLTNNDPNVFWEIKKNGSINHIPSRFKNYLQNQGFYKYKNISNEFEFVFVEDRKMKVLTETEIKDNVLRYLEKKGSVYEFYANKSIFFGESHLNLIDTIHPNIMKDNFDSAYIYYKNYILEVKKDSVKELKYSDTGCYVWTHSILDRNFYLNEDKGHFEDFIEKISGENNEAIKTAIGYLMHSFKRSSDSKAVIFYDETEDTDPNGRTGKSLIGRSLMRMKSVCYEEGKTWNTKSDFIFQKVKDTNNIFFIDDAKQGFDFETLFSAITGDWVINRKGIEAYTIPFSDAPKMLFTTNYPIGGSGDSFEDRKAEYEIKRFFHAKYKPAHLYGYEFWSEYWDGDEWAKFDTFMIKCLQLYLTKGLIQPKLKTIPLRGILLKIGQDMYDIFEKIEVKERNYINNITAFVNDFAQKDSDKLKPEVVSKKYKKYLEYKGFDIKNNQDSNGGRYWMVINTDKLANNAEKNLDDKILF